MRPFPIQLYEGHLVKLGQLSEPSIIMYRTYMSQAAGVNPIMI